MLLTSVLQRKVIPMVTATAAVSRGINSPFSFEEITLDSPNPDEILVKISSTGLCHTDLAVLGGDLPSPLPLVLGHEGAGTIVEIGSSVRGFAVGDNVAVSFASCGHCSNCLQGKEAYCDNFFALNFGGAREDGTTTMTDAAGAVVHGSFFGQSSFATYALVEARNAVKVPNSIDVNLTGPLGCGVQTGAGTVINTLKVPAGSSIIVSGTGAVGLSAIMAAKAVGATTIIAVDIIQSRLDTALTLGATHAVNGMDTDVVEQLLAITGGVGAEFAVDTTANGHVMENDIAAVRFGGNIALIGVPKPGATIPIAPLSGKNFYGVVEGDAVPQIFIPQLIAMYEAGMFPFDRLITTYPFAEIDRAIADTKSGAAIKAVLVMP
jgi:aryl-alcohol dehydrogenase